MSISKLGALTLARPLEAKEEILAALSRSGCNFDAAAAALETNVRSLYRYIEKLRIWPDVDEIRGEKRSGAPRPPRMHERIVHELVEAKGNLARAARAMEITIPELTSKIESLGLWNEINVKLKEAGHPVLERPAK